MAQFTGYECDVCHVASRDKAGWMHLSTHAQTPGAKGSGWDICGNKCLLKLARERTAEARTDRADGRGRHIPDEEKQAIIDFALEHDEASAAEKFGCSVRSVQRWLEKAS
jgi:hypothetical protein